MDSSNGHRTEELPHLILPQGVGWVLWAAFPGQCPGPRTHEESGTLSSKMRQMPPLCEAAWRRPKNERYQSGQGPQDSLSPGSRVAAGRRDPAHSRIWLAPKASLEFLKFIANISGSEGLCIKDTDPGFSCKDLATSGPFACLATCGMAAPFGAVQLPAPAHLGHSMHPITCTESAAPDPANPRPASRELTGRIEG